MTESRETENVTELVKDATLDSVKEGLEEFKDTFISHLERKDFFKALVNELNESIDVPIIGENTERKIFKGILKCIIAALKKINLDSHESSSDSDSNENTSPSCTT